MDFKLTNHAKRKLEYLAQLGWDIRIELVAKTLTEPDLELTTEHGEMSAISYLGGKHILRVIYKSEGGIKKVITVHISRKGRYGS